MPETVDAGLSPDDFGERLSFFFNAHNHFFQEVAKFRAARRLWARLLRERLGVTNPHALALRFHAQTGGSTLTAQQPENNIVRVAIQALSAVCRRRPVAAHELLRQALALPTEHAARIALRTQQILQNEGGRTDTADPLGGSYFIEELTDELEARALELIDRVEELGGAVAAVEAGFVQEEIEGPPTGTAAGGGGRAGGRRGQRLRRGRRTSDRDPAPRPGDRAAPARADGARACRAERRARQLRRWPRCRGRRGGDAEPTAADARGVAAGCTVGEICEGSARSGATYDDAQHALSDADPARLPDVPGA